MVEGGKPLGELMDEFAVRMKRSEQRGL